jgi:hypothetical protein
MTKHTLLLTAVLLAAACGPHFPPHPPMAPSVLSAVCRGASKGAKVQVWRHPDDASIATIELVPDVYFDANGSEVLRLKHIDVGSGSPEALENDERRDSVIQDGKRAEKLACP